MSHNINGFIGPIDELQRLTTGLNHAKIVLLDVDGLGFLPYTHDLSDEIGKGWYKIGPNAKKPLVHVETDYFGGAGEQSAAFWTNGQKTFKRKTSGAINQALKLLGVKATQGNDEFDTVGLGKYRSNEDWAEEGIDAATEMERQEALSILDQLVRTRDESSRNTTGDPSGS